MPPSRTQLAQQLRRQVSGHIFDDSGAAPAGVAIYALSDPRAVRAVRYVGQSAAPRRRYLQHMNAARLWLPDERPWWVASPRLRPLYSWIRELFRDEGRFPVMVVHRWIEPQLARSAERAHICLCLEQQQALLNFEYERLERQLLLI